MKLSFFRCLGAFAFVASAHARIQGTQVQDIPTTAIANGGFKTLVAALGAAGLVPALSAPNGPFTVFAPPDAAFGALPAGLVDCLLLPQNIDALTSILKYHVVSGKVTSGMLQTGPVTTLNGEDINIDISNGVTINESTNVAQPFDVETFNGVIHSIDSVLVPPSIDVSAFMATCPPPTGAATPPAQNSGQPIQGQVITGQTGTPPVEDELVNIPETAVKNGFNTLVQAVVAAGLDGALAGPGPFTVFAPTDNAFAGLPAGLVTCLLLPSNLAVLTALLQYHVVSGKVESGDLSNGAVVPTLLAAASITVDLTNGVQIKGANTVTVTTPDVQATNGVIHVINGVLVPPPPFDLAAFIATCPAPVPAPSPATTPTSSNGMKMPSVMQTAQKKKNKAKSDTKNEKKMGKQKSSRRN